MGALIRLEVAADRGVPRQVEGRLVGVADGVQLRGGGAGLVPEVGAADVAGRVDRGVLRAVGDAGAEEQVDPLLLGDAGGPVGDPVREVGVVRRERVGQVVPGDDRDQRVDPLVLHRHGVLDLAAVGAADHADARVAGRLLGDEPDPVLRAVRPDVALRAGQHVDHLLAGLAVVVRVVERDLAAGAREAEAGVGEDDVALLDEAAADGGLVAVVLAAAEAVGGEDRRRLARPRGVVRLVEVGVDHAALVVVRAHRDVHRDVPQRVARGGVRGGGGRAGGAAQGEPRRGQCGCGQCCGAASCLHVVRPVGGDVLGSDQRLSGPAATWGGPFGVWCAPAVGRRNRA